MDSFIGISNEDMFDLNMEGAETGKEEIFGCFEYCLSRKRIEVLEGPCIQLL